MRTHGRTASRDIVWGVVIALGVACGSLDEGPKSSAGSAGSANGGGAGVGGAANVGAATGSGGVTTGAGTGTGGTTSGGSGGSSSTGFDAALSADVGVEAGPTTGRIDASADSDASAPSEGGTSGTCVTAGTELCDDFETGQLDLQKWKVVKPTASASLAVDDTRAHRGKYALHIKVVPGQSSTAQIADAVTFPAASNTFYTRAFIYLAPDLPADNNGGFHTAYLLATGNNDLGFVEAGLASAGNKQYLGYSEYYGSGPDNHAHGATFTEFGPRSQLQYVPVTWICLELLQGGDATTTTRRVWVDGNELIDQRSDFKDRKPPQFALMSIGVLEYHPTPILSDVWFDDVRVSKQRIGCDL